MRKARRSCRCSTPAATRSRRRCSSSRGREAGLVPGSAVIDEHGVVGQVTRVHPTMSEVTLVTDKDHAVPVKAERSGVRSVLYGAGTGRAPELTLHAAVGGHPRRRPAGHLGHRRHLSAGARGRAGHARRARDRADVRAHRRARRWAASTAARRCSCSRRRPRCPRAPRSRRRRRRPQGRPREGAARRMIAAPSAASLGEALP